MALTYVKDKDKKDKKGDGTGDGKGKGGGKQRGSAAAAMQARRMSMRPPPQAAARAAAEPPGRSSVRSKASSGSAAAAPAFHRESVRRQQPPPHLSSFPSQPAAAPEAPPLPAKGSQRGKALKDCCRATFLFLFTQVGVGGMVVIYTLAGASIFQYIETLKVDPTLARAAELRQETVASLWKLTDTFNVLNRDRWNREVNQTLMAHQMGIVALIRDEGYDERSEKQRWTFSASLMFALSVISMIGYGNVVPRTKAGKITAIVYACFGIPVYILYFMNMGKVLAAVLKWVYTKAYRWNVRRKWKQSVNYDPMTGGNADPEMDAELNEAYLDELEQQVIVPSTTCLYVMVCYLLLGTVMFAEWEHWDYLDSVYFCVTSLLKIGFGDFVPGTHAALEGKDSTEMQAKLVITSIYLLVGMGVVAMCYYLLREEVTVRLAQFKQRMRIRVLRLKVRLGAAPPEALEAALQGM